jgi:hypothetical protein
MAKIKPWARAAKRKDFASKAEVRAFVDAHLDSWHDQGLSPAQVHERSTQMLADAATGVEFINDKPVYGKALGSILKAEGCFTTDSVARTASQVAVNSAYL